MFLQHGSVLSSEILRLEESRWQRVLRVPSSDTAKRTRYLECLHACALSCTREARDGMPRRPRTISLEFHSEPPYSLIAGRIAKGGRLSIKHFHRFFFRGEIIVVSGLLGNEVDAVPVYDTALSPFTTRPCRAFGSVFVDTSRFAIRDT